MTTDTRFRVFANFYKDSVALMQVGAALRKRPGVAEASCVMATPANLEQLANAKLEVDATVNPSDLLVVVRGEAQACDDALEAAQALLQSEPTGGGESAAFSIPLTSIAAAVEQSADADLALISVPGDYAAAEAMKALSLGLHVMLFSDNVGVDQELAIKRHAEARGLLVMGPDCGTAIINGIPLGFANVVRRGSIGLVAASGTGLQEVTCRIHNLGAGVSQAIGTGGRDLRDEIGGLTMLAGLRALTGDELPPPCGIHDALLWGDALAWGDRTPAFLSAREDLTAMGYHGGGDAVAFVYLRAARDRPPARVEFPAWVLEDGQLDRVMDALRAEIIIGQGYPYSIEAADAVAVISAEDRARFYALFQQFAEREGLDFTFSRKALSKSRRRV